MKLRDILVSASAILVVLCFQYLVTLHIQKNKKLQSRLSSIEQSVEQIPLVDLVGQRFVWGIIGPTLSSESATLITTTHAGGVILMEELTSNDISTVTSQIQSLPHTLPFIIAIDQEGGTVKRMMDDENPGGYQLSTMDDETFCSTMSQTNSKLAHVGININFGIIGDIGWFPSGYITSRTYGNTLESVLPKTALAIRCSSPMLTAIKHFPGHGRTLLNSHLTIPMIQTPFAEWMKTDARPFITSIKQGIDIIMFGHLRYDSIASEPASLSPFFHTFISDKGFTGLTITDDLGMLENSNIEAISTMKQAFAAGNDLLLYVTSKEDPYLLFQEALVYATSSSQIYNSFKQHYDHIQTFKQKKLTH